MNEPREAGSRLVALQLDDYGPWTTTPTPRRETDLQALQARLFADVADFFGERDGYAFASRLDNMVGVATQVSPDEFERLQEQIRNRYPITLSVGVGTAETPAAALQAAGSVLQQAGSAQAADRREVLGHRVADGRTDAPTGVTVAHFDIVDATGTFTDRVAPTEARLRINKAMTTLASYLYTTHEAVTHFVGGDNAIAICPPLERAAINDAIDHVGDTDGVELQAGVGHGPTAHAAGFDAKHALETCRETGRRVHGPWEVATD